jgi:hypothetical protein
MSDNIVINYVYGGNDIAGKVGGSVMETDPIPTELTDAAANGITPADGDNKDKNTKKYSAFVLTRYLVCEATTLNLYCVYASYRPIRTIHIELTLIHLEETPLKTELVSICSAGSKEYQQTTRQ